MAKGTSFADKAKRGDKKEKDFTVVKYVKSVESEKTGGTRFQETMLKVPQGKSLDAYLKELETEPGVEEENQTEVVEAGTEEAGSSEEDVSEEETLEQSQDKADDAGAESEENSEDAGEAEKEESQTDEPIDVKTEEEAIAEETANAEESEAGQDRIDEAGERAEETDEEESQAEPVETEPAENNATDKKEDS